MQPCSIAGHKRRCMANPPQTTQVMQKSLVWLLFITHSMLAIAGPRVSRPCRHGTSLPRRHRGRVLQHDAGSDGGDAAPLLRGQAARPDALLRVHGPQCVDGGGVRAGRHLRAQAAPGVAAGLGRPLHLAPRGAAMLVDIVSPRQAQVAQRAAILNPLRCCCC